MYIYKCVCVCTHSPFTTHVVHVKWELTLAEYWLPHSKYSAQRFNIGMHLVSLSCRRRGGGLWKLSNWPKVTELVAWGSDAKGIFLRACATHYSFLIFLIIVVKSWGGGVKFVTSFSIDWYLNFPQSSDIFLKVLFNFELLVSRFTYLLFKYVENPGNETEETETRYILFLLIFYKAMLYFWGTYHNF